MPTIMFQYLNQHYSSSKLIVNFVDDSDRIPIEGIFDHQPWVCCSNVSFDLLMNIL